MCRAWLHYGSAIKHELHVNNLGEVTGADGSAGARVILLGYLRSHDPLRWIVHEDHTLSPSSHPDLVLGWGKMKQQQDNYVSQDTAILMAKGSKNGRVVRLVESADEVEALETNQARYK